jgi:hypothetical protein
MKNRVKKSPGTHQAPLGIFLFREAGIYMKKLNLSAFFA